MTGRCGGDGGRPEASLGTILAGPDHRRSNYHRRTRRVVRDRSRATIACRSDCRPDDNEGNRLRDGALYSCRMGSA